MSPQKTLLIALVSVVMVPVLFLMMIIMVVTSTPPPSGTQGMVCSPGQTPDGSIAGYRGEQLANAALIVAAGQEMRLPQRAWVVAVAVAMQESTLINVGHGDQAGPDSRGLFQQRASWGPLAVRMDPKGAAKLFYERLIALPGWDSLPLTVAAQRVQISAFPNAYARHEQSANQVVGGALGIHCAAAGGENPQNPRAQAVIDRAMSQLGVPYAWGGGNATGPTRGFRDGGVADSHGDFAKTGFDCSGLAQYAYAGIGVYVPHQTQAIWQAFQPAIRDRAQVSPGDLILLSRNGTPGQIHHVGIYLGNGRVVEAPQSGGVVQVREDIWKPGSYYESEFIGAVRPGVPQPQHG